MIRIKFLAGLLAIVLLSGYVRAGELSLKFNDGTFKILNISDTHFGVNKDERGIALIEMLVETEKPDLIIVNGDMAGPGKKFKDMKKGISYLTDVLEKTRVPWAVTFGNHDAETEHLYGVSKVEQINIYEQCAHNVNSGWQKDISGVGNKNLLIMDSNGSKPVFNIWLLDSFSDAADPANNYEWLHADQVYWYYSTSKALEKEYGKKIPALMFFHVPLLEIKQMVAGSKIIGSRQEPEVTSNINSGMFAAILDRGDVKGLSHGHDHQNNYMGIWKGVMMGYSGVTGYNCYPHIPKDDPANNHIRGGRVFLIRESEPGNIKTWMRFAGGEKNWETESYIKYNLKK